LLFQTCDVPVNTCVNCVFYVNVCCFSIVLAIGSRTTDTLA